MSVAETVTTEAANGRSGALGRLARRWPTAAGVALAGSFAGQIAAGTADSADVAHVVTASALVYLGSAALGMRGAAWPMFGVTFVLIGLGLNLPGFDPTLWMVGIAAVLATYGLARGALRPAWGLPLQSAAMVALAAAAILAVTTNPVLAGVLVSVSLFAHAAWDVYHHRTERVVSRSMAEFCAVLDTLVAVLILVVTFL